MATKTTTQSRAVSRPSRPLLFLLLLLIGLNALVLIQHWKPRQGLDLVGGTSVILTPKGAKPTAGALVSAVEIIRQRVNGTGVTSAEVVREGDNIRVSLPAVGRNEALRIVGTTAELTFRPVLQTLGAGPAPEPTAAPTPSGSVRPSGSASARPSGSPSGSATVRPTASTTARPRPVTGALLPGQAPSPTPTATPTAGATARPSGTATPRPSGTPKASATPTDPNALTIEQAITQIDCSDPAGRQRIAAWFGNPLRNTEQIVSCDVTGDSKYLLGPAEMTGRDVEDAEATIDTGGSTIGTGRWIVALDMKSASKWAAVTEKYTNQQIAIVLDGLTQSAPNVEQRIPDGSATISGSFNERSARALANVLKYGALPVQFEQSQTQTISPTLGERSLDGALLAGFLGLGLVLLYAIFYYRALGIVTIVGMLVFALLNWLAIVVLGEIMGFTVTLAGIAGLIVSVGISADSYVVFYERLRDEVRAGKSVQQSVARGFSRAFQTILSADMVSFLAAVTLYLLSVGEVRGFAFTLGLATLIDIFVAWFYTRPVVTLLARTRMFREGRFGGLAGTTHTTVATPKEA
jgi:preprotein translocase subunit SecD